MKFKKYTLFFYISIFWTSFSLQGQSELMQKVDFSVTAHAIADALFLLSETADVNIVFSAVFFDSSVKISYSGTNQTLKTVLKSILKNTGIGIKLKTGSVLLYRKKVKTYDLSGYIRDKETGETLPGATVFNPITGIGISANGYGYFCIKVPKGEVRLQFSYVGYRLGEKALSIKRNTQTTIKLSPSNTLKGVLVVSSVMSKHLQEEANQHHILTQKMSTFPVPGGEPDLLRQLQMLPGVQTGADGLGGLHIRGGNADQNLILLDDVPIFNPSHSIGLFSIFNTSIIKKADLTKGGFPARYGGRLSSVLEVRTKEGSFEKPSASIGISLLATTLIAEAPLVKNKISLLIAARRSHLDIFLRNKSRQSKLKKGKIGKTDYHFIDGNAKLNFQLSKKDRFYLSFYGGGDYFEDDSKIHKSIDNEFNETQENLLSYKYNWGNKTISLRWNHLYNDKLFSNTTFIYSQFKYDSQIENKTLTLYSGRAAFNYIDRIKFNSAVEELSIHTDFDYFLNENHHLKMGGGLSRRLLTPTIYAAEQEENLLDSMLTITIPLDLNSVSYIGIETYGYFSDEWKFNRWKINVGLRITSFFDSQTNHSSLQPRLNSKYYVNNQSAISFSVARMSQFLHLLTTTDSSLPNDLWVPVTAKVKPENSWITTFGFHQKLGEKWLLNTEIYLKQMTNLPVYADSVFSQIETQSIDAKTWEDLVQIGKGESKGWEILLEKHKGRLNGWVSYTLSQTNRKFKGKEISYRFDSRHLFHLQLGYTFSNRLSLNIGWNYQSGLPIGDYHNLLNNFLFADLFKRGDSKLNNKRLPSYHRLDIGLSGNFETNKILHQFSLGIYNLYNRKNAFIAYPVEEGSQNWKQINALPVIPSLRYVLVLK